MGFINSLSNNYLQSILTNAVQSAGLNTNPTTNSSSASSTSTIAGLPTDKQQLSPFAQLLGTLQQLQQSDPSKYQQVTQQIATNLQGAAQTAQADGDTPAASQLNQLATDFTNASTSGQLPNVQDLAQATAGQGHHHGHHHSHAASADPASSATDPSSSSLSQTLSHFLSGLQGNGTPNGSLDPMAIILNTLST